MKEFFSAHPEEAPPEKARKPFGRIPGAVSKHVLSAVEGDAFAFSDSPGSRNLVIFAASILALWTALIPAVLAGPPAGNIAAIVDDWSIPMSDVDAPSRNKIDRLGGELSATVQAAIDRAIDDLLRATAGESAAAPVAPISDAVVREYRKAHPEAFSESRGAQSDPAFEEAAVRHLLEQRARATAEADARRQRLEGHSVERLVPPPAELERPLAADLVVARIDGRSVAAGTIEVIAALRLYRLRGELYRERRRNLDALIDSILLEREASRLGISPQALAERLSQRVPVSEQELQAFVESERSQGRPVADPERVRPYLEFRKSHAKRSEFLTDLRRGSRIEVLLLEPAMPSLPMVEDGAPALGPPGGPRVIAYTNYRCRTCRATHRELDRIRELDAGVRVVFRDFIPVYDPAADEAARLARCAAEAGAFAAVRRELLAREPPPFGERWFDDKGFDALAHRVGLDSKRFRACATAEATRRAIDRDTAHARELGFEDAPAFVAAGAPLSGTQSAEKLLEAAHGKRAHPVTAANATVPADGGGTAASPGGP